MLSAAIDGEPFRWAQAPTDPVVPIEDATQHNREGGKLVAVLYLVGVLNGFAAAMVQSIHAEGLWQALGWSFGISIIDVGATAVGINLARQGPQAPLTHSDYFAVVVAALLILVSYRGTGWAAVIGLAVYEMARNRHSALFLVGSERTLGTGARAAIR